MASAPEEMFPELAREAPGRRAGVLPYQDLQTLIESGRITANEAIADQQVQPSSVDLRLGAEAIQVRASFLPGVGGTVAESMRDLEIQRLPLAEGMVLLKGAVYVIPLMESLKLSSEMHAKANPKSTTGRLDVFARLIADGAEQFDRVGRGYAGPLYVEVAPKTFNIRVRTGTTLNQMRFLRGVPPQADTSRKASREHLVFGPDGEPLKATVFSGLWFSVDLEGPGESGLIGWKARHNAPVIDLDRIGYYDPEEFWEPVRAHPGGELILQPGEFYILGSRERVRVPKTYAAEMVPYDPAMGEFRVHYAGFFDPGFGYGSGELRGTRAILEVRSHDVPYALRHGQNVGRLVYERLLSEPTKLYGTDSGSSYQFQELGLSKQFRMP